MKTERPQFELAHVSVDETKGSPEIIPVSQVPQSANLARRGFLGIGIGAASALLFIDGKAADRGNGEHSQVDSTSGADDASGTFTPAPSNVLKAHRGSVNALAVSPDGKTIISGSGDNTIKLWSLADGKLRSTLEGHRSEVKALAISPDGTKLSSRDASRTIKLWSLSLPEGRLLSTPHGVKSLAISPNGKILASAAGEKDIQLWSLSERKMLATLEGHTKSVRMLAISPNGNILASSADDRSIKLWSLPEGKLLATFQTDAESVHQITFAADSKALLSRSTNGIAKLWSLPEGKLLTTQSGVRVSAISPDGKNLALASVDIRIVPVSKGKALTLKGHSAAVNSLAFTPDGSLLASGSEDHFSPIRLWSLAKGKLLSTVQGDKVLGITADGKTLLSASSDGNLGLWSLPDAKLLATVNAKIIWNSIFAISPDGKMLVVASNDGTTALWSLPEGKLLTTLRGSTEAVEAIAISPDGNILACGLEDSTIKLWSLPEGKFIASLASYPEFVEKLAITPNGKTLATIEGKAIKLWSLPEGRLLSTFEDHQGYIKALAVSPDGRILLSGDSEGVVILWDLEKHSFLSFLFDSKQNEKDAISYNVYDHTSGRFITYILPCGSPIPAGATCTCNCVPGTFGKRISDPPLRPTIISPSPSPTISPLPEPSGGSRSSTQPCGQPIPPGQTCTCNCIPSDRDVKEAFEATDPMLILQRLSELPIQTWNYKWNDAAVRHIGPMAQDFAAAFAVGEDDKHICTVDAQGVALAAIQGLYRILQEKDAQLEDQRGQTESLREQLQQQQSENLDFKTRIEALECSIITRK
ncbi:MAG: tail fiber domain-containing protein [Acidobacteriota bacterium]|nr:tail fiber domain-containing protein [Acidobacteriota bacterium]